MLDKYLKSKLNYKIAVTLIFKISTFRDSKFNSGDGLTMVKVTMIANRTLAFLLGVFSIIIVALLDYYTGPDIAFSLFYLIPVSFFAWQVGLRAGMLSALASAIVWFYVDLISNRIYTNLWIDVWNAISRFGFFVVVATLLHLLRQNLERQKQLASIDDLTQLANRRSFYDLANKEIQRASRFQRSLSVVYIDLDNFKLVNDKLGHHVGDTVLTTVARTLSLRLRKIDIIGRLGGDEFSILLPETNQSTARQLVEKIQFELLSAMQAEHWPVTFSIGVISTDGLSTLTIENLVKMADTLMYSVKNQGKSGINYKNLDHDFVQTPPITNVKLDLNSKPNTLEA